MMCSSPRCTHEGLPPPLLLASSLCHLWPSSPIGSAGQWHTCVVRSSDARVGQIVMDASCQGRSRRAPVLSLLSPPWPTKPCKLIRLGGVISGRVSGAAIKSSSRPSPPRLKWRLAELQFWSFAPATAPLRPSPPPPYAATSSPPQAKLAAPPDPPCTPSRYGT